MSVKAVNDAIDYAVRDIRAAVEKIRQTMGDTSAEVPLMEIMVACRAIDLARAEVS